MVLVCLVARTVITVSPQDVHFTRGLEEARFHCEASSDDSTPVIVIWEKDDALIDKDADPRITTSSTELIINLVGLSVIDTEMIYMGEYMCVAYNGYSLAKAKAAFKHGNEWLWIRLSYSTLRLIYQEIIYVQKSIA